MIDNSELNSVFLHQVYRRLEIGDSGVLDELLSKVQVRLERLARKMLRGFPGVHRWEDTGDVMQTATLRLLRALEHVKPDSERAFFGLAAEQIRRVLLDLVRHYQGVQGLGANYASVAGQFSPGQDSQQLFTPLDPVASDPPAAELERWQAFHESIEKLPAEEREVIELSFYHGWTQAEIADLLQVSERTVRRYWQAACLRLHDLLGGDLPIG